MTNSWWIVWFVFMALFLVTPAGYGWGYRGWGPPYPRYIQRRRGERAVDTSGPATFNHRSWGWRGDLVWMVLLVGAFWAAMAFWWR